MSRQSLESILQVLAKAGSEHLGGRAAIFLVDETRKTLKYCASAGLAATYIEAIHGFEIGPHSPSCGTAAYTGELVVVGDVARDPLWAPFLALARQHGIAACWSQPLKDAKGATIGTFALYHEVPRRPTPQELQAIDLLASTASLLIERSIADTTLQNTLAALQRSELASRELSHRVMNTFHVLEGVLTVKIRSMTDPASRAITAEALERVRAMSLVHHKLFKQTQDSGDEVDVSVFLDSLVADLSQAFAMDKNLKLLLSSDPGIFLPAERCTTLGLLAVELVLNAIKHAFDDTARKGTIAVALHRQNDWLEFSVRDNGKGLPNGALVAKKASLGTRLIHAFVGDLDGELTVRNGARGAEFLVALPLSD
ncbi:GAF domain-containing protein [Pseudomonas sp. dw_358]|uniref:GAF domain-containing protein n=1 Tax=Pseudomonas sp. dw_358 TaxID=2720083 RepID=UPI001BD4E88F